MILNIPTKKLASRANEFDGIKRIAVQSQLTKFIQRSTVDTVDGRNPAPLGNHKKPLSVGIYKGIIIPGLLGWCEMDFVHPQYVRVLFDGRACEPGTT